MIKRKSYHFFEIKGLNQERLFNELSKKFEIFEIERLEKNRSRFKVKYFDGVKVRKALIAAGYEIINEKRNGLFFYLTNFCTSYGLIAGIALSIILFAVQSPFIQKVEVWGVDDCSQIQKFVEDNLPSKSKGKIDTAKIELMIKNNFDDISFVSAAIVGQSLVINVKNAVVPDEMDGTFSPLVSQYDGVITSINLIQGTLKVDVGDIIQKGQILVEGRVINSEGESFNIQPKAEIFMDVWIEGEATHFDKQVITVRTGESYQDLSVSLFGQEFYSHKGQKQFSSFEVEESSQPLIKNNILPFILTKSVYYETITQTIESTFDQKREEIIAQAKAICLQNLGECEIIKEENYRIIEGAGCTTVKYVITAGLQVTGEK